MSTKRPAIDHLPILGVGMTARHIHASYIVAAVNSAKPGDLGDTIARGIVVTYARAYAIHNFTRRCLQSCGALSHFINEEERPALKLRPRSLLFHLP